ncbi:metal ABC transporter ATP-binding protein [Hoyosella subflava]|uniref:Putative cation ABC transporter, ATP-binding protein n=1 Tax=Hoyosella subflava (strain DSM 45089 / JCM 17490 / NBRC 109087 / DQS3-9A1) TaxID=443218 RepID=F6EJQ8_HOYSD|nr:metal ABC transporter ATP-binding protein [Hoyosella subflava]AEF40083.1 Putative cation ABC transporter, ATP-binding protein [Hoyosella subflava DQS3-9A1]
MTSQHAQTPPSPAIEVRDLTVAYRSLVALRSVSLTVPWGQVYGLIGTNGSGKSTLFKSIMGILRPNSGTVLINGGSAAIARRRSLISYVPQSEDVDWSFPLSVREVVMMGRYGSLNWLRTPRRKDRTAVSDALEKVGMADFADRQIGQLSGGQRKRVFVARALAQGAAIVLLDEPFTGVDKTSEATISFLLRRLAAEGKTILVSTHDLHSLPGLCDAAALINKTVLLHGTPAEVLKPDNLALAFGANPFAARHGATTGGATFVHAPLAG